eukprot:1132201-Amorphochlora_amoeboformis.AAC.1
MPFMVCLFSIGLGSLPRAHAAVPSDIDSDLTEQLDAYSKHKRQALNEIDHTSLDRFKHEYKQYIHNKPRNKFENPRSNNCLEHIWVIYGLGCRGREEAGCPHTKERQTCTYTQKHVV